MKPYWKSWKLGAVAAALLLGSGISLLAQDAPSGLPPGPPPGGGVGPFFDAIGVQGFAAGPRDKVVTGSPYSATFSTQFTQTLQDGNQITRTTKGTFARDSQGRTRRDLTLGSIGPWAAEGKTPPHVAFINDVVTDTEYVLQPDRKTARKMSRPSGGPQDNGSVSPPRPPNENLVTTSLGTQTMNGVSVDGTRYTRTIPAGTIGNTKPVVIVTERWYSSELQSVVMSKRNDPRTGQTVFQLTNIERGEPDPALFVVPPDYTVKEGKPRTAVVIRPQP